jgi:hypothetical protein
MSQDQDDLPRRTRAGRIGSTYIAVMLTFCPARSGPHRVVPGRIGQKLRLLACLPLPSAIPA